MILKIKERLILLVFVFTITACGELSQQDGGATVTSKGTTQAEITAAGKESTEAATQEQDENLILDLEEVTATVTAEVGTVTATSEPTLTPFPEEWMRLPVVPEVSERAVEIYLEGLERGNNPQAFSKIGDCQNVTDFFFSAYENPASYTLGEQYAYLAPAVEQFQGSFGRESLAVQGGMNVAAVLSPLRADPTQCGGKYSPLICEIVRHRPSIAMISFEEWWGEKSAETYEGYMRQVVEQTIALGVVPILVTKADNLEGDHSINQVIVKLAQEYQIPLWNFWRAVQDLPDQGLQDDLFHLTYKRHCYHFDQAECLEYAWTLRNLTGLQSLHAVWKELSQKAQAE